MITTTYSDRNTPPAPAALVRPKHAVLVLDDDPSTRNSLERLLTGRGYQVRLHREPDEIFRAGLPQEPACLILDHQLNHGLTGIEVHAELLRRGWDIPTVFTTAQWNVQMVVNAIRGGADGFLTKPLDPAELVDAVAHALTRSQASKRESLQAATAAARAASLSDRERAIVRLAMAGLLNKEIADRLNLALATVKLHRGRAMRKLGAGNAVELARIAALAGVGC